MALRGYKTPDDPLPSQRRQKFESGTFRGAFSAVEMGRPSGYDVIGQKLNRSDSADPFVRAASKDSYESRFAGVGPDAPDVGSVDDGRSTRR